MDNNNYLFQEEDYKKLGITEDDINKYRNVFVCSPKFVKPALSIIELASKTFKDQTLILSVPYMEEDKIVCIDDSSLKRALIINYLIKNKEANNDEKTQNVKES
mgnify:CR=1 FL=1